LLVRLLLDGLAAVGNLRPEFGRRLFERNVPKFGAVHHSRISTGIQQRPIVERPAALPWNVATTGYDGSSFAAWHDPQFSQFTRLLAITDSDDADTTRTRRRSFAATTAELAAASDFSTASAEPFSTSHQDESWAANSQRESVLQSRIFARSQYATAYRTAATIESGI
jgi:hypothetical protein